MPLKIEPVIDRAAQLRCPLLGLFGAEDTHPSPAETQQTAEVLKQHGKTFDFHTFDGAGHGFFATDRPSYRVEAAKQGWQMIFDWFGRYLSA
jgi:carboxymethylenebutenolidase